MRDPTSMTSRPATAQVIVYDTPDSVVRRGCVTGTGDRLADAAADGGCVRALDRHCRGKPGTCAPGRLNVLTSLVTTGLPDPAVGSFRRFPGCPQVCRSQ